MVDADGTIAIGTAPPNGVGRGHAGLVVYRPGDIALEHVLAGSLGRITAFAWAPDAGELLPT